MEGNGLKAGVEIPPEVAARSQTLKKKRGKTLANLPVFRDAAKLLQEVVIVQLRGPKSLRRFYDEMVANTAEILKTVGMANAAVKAPDDRVWYLDSAVVLVEVEREYFATLQDTGILSEDSYKKVSALTKRIVAQLVGWRDYTKGEGADHAVDSGNPVGGRK